MEDSTAALPAVGWGAGTAAAAGDPLPAPKPIPGGITLPGNSVIHVFALGPTTATLPFTGVTLQGLDVESSVFTDFQGDSAVAFQVGTATGHDGTRYNLGTDIRAFEGEYVAMDGRRRRGTFAFLRARDVPVIDSFQFLGPSVVPASVSFDLRWEATGPAVPRGLGAKAPNEKHPAAFLGEIAPARANGSCSGVELGIAFRSDGPASTERGYAQLGRERNGVFLR